MVDRYFKIYGKLDRVDDALVDVIRTARENVQLKSLYEDFKKLKGVNKKLQAEMLSLHDFLGFENGVAKHLVEKQSKLSSTEHAAIAKVMIPTNGEPRR
ncbi:hypothetical protein PC118_g17534 [Phytophthora cactorum]|uniref:Uncharacterized protein n=1 Tax=Phytophthora cactorum TaxID=29920 RepID=A0A8T1B8Q1_9STRA|nr:hypothetical protein PC112_g15473 [Phytophthora cactorum]KAG2897166.1 hypothetical protein PC115_g17289 [Phytophthora cactorum]KAG2969282.1 hypothetical protein PC118_g17534 [Phytophthora cactorum]KAG3067366.1 hypothetical protein PC122_g17378 [Phytophthora cactorum]